MKIVSDTSPLLNLAVIDRLDLLEKLFAEILIPPMVRMELCARGASDPVAERILERPWIKVVALESKLAALPFGRSLDAGETEAIALALQVKADRILMDETRGRRTAKDQGLKVLGLIGVFQIAKHEGLVDRIAPLIDEVILSAGFRLDEELVARVLRDVGEGPDQQ